MKDSPLLIPALFASVTAVSMALPMAANANDQGLCGFSATVQFNEGAPTDSFVFSNTSSGNWKIIALTLDMSPSIGNLIFDVTDQGAGVEVFQPFQSDDGAASLREQPDIVDGDQGVALAFNDFSPGAQFRFTIDVDDQLNDSALGQIRVAGSEMSGAVLTLDVEDTAGESHSVSGTFNDRSQLIFSGDSCS